MWPKYHPGNSYDYLFLNRETYGVYNFGEKEKILQDRWKSHGYAKTLVEYIKGYNNYTTLRWRLISHAYLLPRPFGKGEESYKEALPIVQSIKSIDRGILCTSDAQDTGK
jgi:hypothetical protein